MIIRVLICDELPVIRGGFRTLLDTVPDIDGIDTTDNGMEAIILVRTARPDVVFTDLSLRIISGLEMIRRLGKGDARSNIVVFTGSDADKTVSDVLHASASCLLGKDASPEVTELTPRERDVTQMVARGISIEEVARELTIGVATVRTHLYWVRTKLGVRDRAQLVSLAYRSGLIRSAGRVPGDEKFGPQGDLRTG